MVRQLEVLSGAAAAGRPHHQSSALRGRLALPLVLPPMRLLAVLAVMGMGQGGQEERAIKQVS
jgi:hypothetical protein